MATKTLQGKLGSKKKPGKFQSIPQKQSADPVLDALAMAFCATRGCSGIRVRMSVEPLITMIGVLNSCDAKRLN